MKAVTKYTDNTGGESNSSGAVTATTDYLFFLAEFEVYGACFNANQYEQNYQAQYDYYKTGNSKIKYRHDATGTAVHCFCRSASRYNSSSFCIINISGNCSVGYAHASYGASPGFCV